MRSARCPLCTVAVSMLALPSPLQLGAELFQAPDRLAPVWSSKPLQKPRSQAAVVEASLSVASVAPLLASLAADALASLPLVMLASARAAVPASTRGAVAASVVDGGPAASDAGAE